MPKFAHLILEHRWMTGGTIRMLSVSPRANVSQNMLSALLRLFTYEPRKSEFGYLFIGDGGDGLEALAVALDLFGQEGWESVSMVQHTTSLSKPERDGVTHTVVLKRPQT